MTEETLDSLPLVVSERGGSGQGCLLLLLSLTSAFLWLVPTISLLYLLIDHTSWGIIVSSAHHWLEHNHWDLMVTRSVWAAVNWVDNNHTVILIVLSGICLTNIALSLMVTASTITNKRGLALPWLVFNAFIILIMLLSFTCWTFISFFISILLAIIFPVLAGVVLGVWILIWKKVYIFHGSPSKRNSNCDAIVVTQPRRGYKSVPGLHHVYNHHNQQHLMAKSET